jgi:hypothetical protein
LVSSITYSSPETIPAYTTPDLVARQVRASPYQRANFILTPDAPRRRHRQTRRLAILCCSPSLGQLNSTFPATFYSALFSLTRHHRSTLHCTYTLVLDTSELTTATSHI